MADIYIAYASPNREAARRLVEQLASRWSVWWDEDLVGRFPQVIDRELQAATCVVPIFSEAAHSADGLRDELNLARKYDKAILPARIDACDPPFGFGAFTAVDLRDWAGEAEHPGWRQLQHKLSQVIAPRARPRRPADFFGKRLQLPSVFMSVSSHETQLSPEDAVKLLSAFQAPTVLISAYDWAPGRISEGRIEALAELKAGGALVLVDSGNYEASRRQDETWTPDLFAKALENAPHDLACSFDVMAPATDPEMAVAEICEAVRRDATFTSAPIVPIVHAPERPGGGHHVEHLPQVICTLAERLQPPLLAVPERELGPGLVARVQMMQRIREALDALPFYQPIHLLGTGNPWSIAALAAAGADSFDGLEWCRVVVDRSNDRLNHFQHFDFFAHQARFADSSVTAAAVDDPDVHFAGRAALHNLDYYAELAGRIQTYALKDGLETVVTALLGEANTRQLRDQVPGLFR